MILWLRHYYGSNAIIYVHTYIEEMAKTDISYFRFKFGMGGQKLCLLKYNYFSSIAMLCYDQRIPNSQWLKENG